MAGNGQQPPGEGQQHSGDGQQRSGDGHGWSDVPGPQPSRGDRRLYFALMATSIGLFVLSWALIDRYSTIAAIVISAVALAIPPFAVIIANVASATDRRRP